MDTMEMDYMTLEVFYNLTHSMFLCLCGVLAPGFPHVAWHAEHWALQQYLAQF